MENVKFVIDSLQLQIAKSALEIANRDATITIQHQKERDLAEELADVKRKHSDILERYTQLKKEAE